MTDQDIRLLASTNKVYHRGLQMYYGAYVLELHTDYVEDEVSDQKEVTSYYIDGTIEGSGGNEYDAWIQYDFEKDHIINYSCECQAAQNYFGMCKHCVALAFESMEKGYLKKKVKYSPKQMHTYTDYRILQLLDSVGKQKQAHFQDHQGNVGLYPKILFHNSSFYSKHHYEITFRIGDAQTYVLKHIKNFLRAIDAQEKVSYGKKLSFVHVRSAFTKDGWEYVKLMQEICDRYSYDTISRTLPVNQMDLAYILKMNLGKVISCEFQPKVVEDLYVLDQEPNVTISLNQTGEDSYSMTIPPLLLVEGREDRFLIMGNCCYRLSEAYVNKMGPVLRIGHLQGPQEFQIANKDMHQFVNDIVTDLEEAGAMDTGDLDLSEYKPVPLSIAYYLDENDHHVMVKVKGSYGEDTINLLEDEDTLHYRDVRKEEAALKMAQSYFPYEDFKEGFYYFQATDDDRQFQLFDTGLRQLETMGKVFASERFRRKKLVRTPRATMGVSIDSGLLNLTVDSSDFSRQELVDIVDSYRKKKKFYRLKSGDFLSLENNAISSIAELLDGLMLHKKDLRGEEIQVPKFRAGFIDQVLAEDGGMLEVNRSSDYKSVIRNMKNVEDSDYVVPEELNGSLRKYQKRGYRWMRTLADLGFGGILADDMGLGKTIQTIAYILGRRQSKLPFLIVCPASLVYNWEREFTNFAPTLTTKMILGSAPVRKALITDETVAGYEADVWITSYDMVKRDIEHYDDITFDTVIIDEAQNIKNPKTLAAKSVKELCGQVRFALTGTPIENRLSELWSIFDFLMPGILGTYPSFRNTFELSIVVDQDEEVMARLKKMVAPFILRRTKKEVLKELPDKVEQFVYAKMDGEQKKLYTGHALRLMESLNGQSEQDVKNGKIEILAELTKLRQICCEPRMLFEDYKGESCKVDVCEELIRDAIEAENKVLIFSQFTSLFVVLEERLKKMGVSYYKLTGETPKRQRLDMAESFNADDTPVFLISLKAGGTGLNLTGANIVIHMDPWWNVAAQNQATDRAHRIGQEEVVTVFKLIASDTIEEKIVKLQEQKAELADEVLSGEGISAAKLTKEDFMEILG